MAFFAVLFGFSCIHLRNFCVVDSATHMNVFPVCSWSAPNRSGTFRCSLRRVVVCICVGAYINNGKQQENREDPTALTRTHTHTNNDKERILRNRRHAAPRHALTPLQLLGSPISGWFIMQKLCKDKQNYESRQQPASKNSTATLCHILLHKASHISPTVLLFPKPKRQSLSGYHSPVPISITKPIPESISLSISPLSSLFSLLLFLS